jgi:hypothetical protein
MASHISGRPFRIAGNILAAAALAGCQQADDTPAEPASAASTLPISLNAAMVSVVDHSADYLFALGNGDMPDDDHDWDLVRSAAYETILSGRLIQMAGTGSNDAAWVADPAWQKMAGELTGIGQQALVLAEQKSTDEAQWRALGDSLVANCLACHEQFKPEIPSDGILHETTGRESRGESIFD